MNFIKENILKVISFSLRKLLDLPPNSSIIIFNGGLGNQLFQYTLSLHLQQKYSKNIFFYDISNHYKIVHKSGILKIFKTKLKFLNSNKIPKFIKHTLFSKYFLKFNNFTFKIFEKKLFPLFVIDHHLKKINLNNHLVKSNFLSIFIGTWHTTINSYNDQIFEDLNFSKDFSIPYNSKYSIKTDFICLHIRRGDYVSQKKASKYHGNLNNEYFLNSVNLIRSKYENLPVFIFTDDPKWVKNNLQPYIINSHLISSDLQDAEIDFFLMTKAKYFIVSNSTFSWWTAFLSTKKDKFIILPKKWFSKGEINSNLIYKYWSYKIME